VIIYSAYLIANKMVDVKGKRIKQAIIIAKI